MTYISKCCDFEATLDEESGEYTCKFCHDLCAIHEEETELDDQDPAYEEVVD